MSADILRAALHRLKQEEKFETFQAYLESEWLCTVEDLSQAAKDEHVWQSLRLPARLKVEMRVLLESIGHEHESHQKNVALPQLTSTVTEKNSTRTDSIIINSDTSFNSSLNPATSHSNAAVSRDTFTLKPAVSIEIVENEDTCVKSEEENEWELYFSEEYQYYYYYNKITGESQWATEDVQTHTNSGESADNLLLPPQSQQQQQWPPAPPNTCTNSDNRSEFVFPKGYSRSESQHRQQVRRHRRDKRHRVQLHRAELADSSSSSENESTDKNHSTTARTKTISRRIISSDSSEENDHFNDGHSSDDVVSNSSEYYIVSENGAGRKLQVERYHIPRDTAHASHYEDHDRDHKAEECNSSVQEMDSLDVDLSAASLLMMSLGEDSAEPSAPPLPLAEPLAEPLVQLLTPPRAPMSPVSTGSVATQPPTPPTPPVPPPKHSMRTTRIGKAFNKIFGLSTATNRSNHLHQFSGHSTSRGFESNLDATGDSFYDA